jgi:hypothetical protein
VTDSPLNGAKYCNAAHWKISHFTNASLHKLPYEVQTEKTPTQGPCHHTASRNRSAVAGLYVYLATDETSDRWRSGIPAKQPGAARRRLRQPLSGSAAAFAERVNASSKKPRAPINHPNIVRISSAQ